MTYSCNSGNITQIGVVVTKFGRQQTLKTALPIVLITLEIIPPHLINDNAHYEFGSLAFSGCTY